MLKLATVAQAMEAAAVLAIILQDYADFALILALLFLNATISFVEESSAVTSSRPCHNWGPEIDLSRKMKRYLCLFNSTTDCLRRFHLQDKAIQALTAALAPKAKVLRDGKIQTIEAADLVPGDIVIARLGDIVPADIKVIGTEDEHDQPLQVHDPLSISP